MPFGLFYEKLRSLLDCFMGKLLNFYVSRNNLNVNDTVQQDSGYLLHKRTVLFRSESNWSVGLGNSKGERCTEAIS